MSHRFYRNVKMTHGTAYKKLKTALQLDIVITITEHGCDHVLKRVLKLSAVPASEKLTHSAGWLVASLRLNAGSTAGRKLLLLWEFSTFVVRCCL